MIYDTDKSGLETVFLPYHIEAWRHIWRKPDHTVYSLDTWKAVLRALEPKKISRASVINFLNAMVEEGFLVYEEEQGTGGTSKRYSPVAGKSDSEQSFKWYLKKKMLDSVRSELI